MKQYLTLIIAAWLMLSLAWAADATAQDMQLIGTATVNVRRGDLNGRKYPDVHSPKVAWFQDGEMISIYEIQCEWVLTEGGEYGTCWVNISYLMTDEAGLYTVTANGRVRLRSTPDGDAIGWLKPGQTVEVLSIFGEWARMEKGWVMAEYLEANK
ncbi:MAG TPA: hypothetical protein PKU80_10950 [Candidatus Limiplasma sp.]|nr:hypothetical protein [Candidatus Limiplasma sp.]